MVATANQRGMVISLKIMMQLINKYQRILGRTFCEKAGYVLCRRLFRFLVSRGILYRNGEVVQKHLETCSNSNRREIPKKIICTTGFGHSGSGVISDLLSEYDGVSVQGFVDANGSLRQEGGLEFDLLRHAGGLFDIEYAITKGNLFIHDSVVKSFMALVASYYYNPKCYYRETLLKRSKEFLDEIVDFVVPSADGYEYCPHLRMLGDRGYDLFYGNTLKQGIFALRDVSVDEYRSLARKYVLSLLSEMASSECLLLDQVVSDFTADVDRYESYLGPIKLIAVYRDPRDVFVTGVKLNEHWIPHDANTFVQWYRRQLQRYHSLKHKDFLLLRFEDLVIRYDESVRIVEGFTDIPSSMHINARSAFDPLVSIKNIGIHKTYAGQDDMALIKRDLEEFCFNG